jgi:cell division protein FtsQ
LEGSSLLFLKTVFSRPRKNPRRLEATRKEGAAARLRAAALRVLKVLFVVALAVGGAFAAVGGQSWLRKTEHFAISRITVTGNARATRAALLERARLSVGQNLFAIDLERARQSLAAHPWVASAEVCRRLPNALEITVVERQSAAVLALGELYLVDSEGEPFKRLQAEDGVDLPLVTGLDREAFEGKNARGKERVQLALLAIAAWQRSAGGKPEALSEARLGAEGVTLVAASGLEVRVGDEDFDSRLSRLARVRAELQQRSLTAQVVRLDNRARPGWVAVQLSGAGLERGRPPKK